jgi:hypothetical protein
LQEVHIANKILTCIK